MKPILQVVVSINFLWVSTLASAQTPAASTSDLTERVDKVFEKWNRTDSPGCALSVTKDGRIVYKHSYGMADLDHNVTITPSTVFHVASISKQFTAASILLLAQQGKLSLNDDVRKYIPELPNFVHSLPSATSSITPAAFAISGICSNSPDGVTPST